ncbi:MAG: helix-turn-helix transcriptional regulator [Lachnospiraceae bacterium]|nr:helix-turn-helix transcriptional regulator [Lachnospiraceae bacterium]
MYVFHSIYIFKYPNRIFRLILNPNTRILIVYEKLWKTLKSQNISQYKLINTYGISTGQLDRLRKNESVSTNTLDKLCCILGCTLYDIAEYIESSDENHPH